MSADAREVLAERMWDSLVGPLLHADAAWADLPESRRVGFRSLLDGPVAAAGVHLSVDGGPPAEPWTTQDEEGRTWRVVPTYFGAALSPKAILRPVPAGEAEPEEAPTSVDGLSSFRDALEEAVASSDGPAAPTCRFCADGLGCTDHEPLWTAPAESAATCDGSGEEGCQTCGGGRFIVIPDGENTVPEPCPDCTPCDQCGTVGGGGWVPVHYWPGGIPCPSCGTAPSEEGS